MLELPVWIDLREIETLVPSDGDYRMYNLVMYEGDVKDFKFRLRQMGSGDRWDVSTATAIKVELESVIIDGQTPDSHEVACTDVAPADWENGLVVARIDSGLPLAIGATYRYALIVTIGGETRTAAVGLLEYKRRAEYTT